MTKLIAGNWKMFKGPAETLEFFDDVRRPHGVDVVLCPPFVSLEAAVGEEWPIYAQNVHWADEGAFTGEVSARMLVELGVEGTLVGHSERRLYFGETDDTVRLRAEAALAAGLAVIACVGETEAEREGGETEAVLRRQVAAVPRHEFLVIAYEPVWAIGTGQDRDARTRAGSARPDQVDPRHARALRGIRETRQCARPLSQRGVDGALVGGASLDPASFSSLCGSQLPSRNARHPGRLGPCSSRVRETPSSSPTHRCSTTLCSRFPHTTARSIG